MKSQKKQNKDYRIGIRLSKDERTKLERFAINKGLLTKSEALRLLINRLKV